MHRTYSQEKTEIDRERERAKDQITTAPLLERRERTPPPTSSTADTPRARALRPRTAGGLGVGEAEWTEMVEVGEQAAEG